MTHRILLVEDEANYRQVISMMIADLDIELLEAGDGQQALEIIEQHDDLDLLITDLNMPRMGGMALLEALHKQQRSIPVVVITAYGTVNSAVEAMRLGAIDYLQKPFEESRLKLTLQRVLKVTELMAENRRLRDAIERRFDFSLVIGESAAMVKALRIAGQVAATDATVLVQGDSGTGKELVARAIHFNSPRSHKPFIAINCAALPDTLLEAELFGAEQGAYTGASRRRRGRVELAEGGTLFLDEIGDMPPLLQAKILRLIQEKTYTPLGGEKEQHANVRFVVATHRDLKKCVATGVFREDLYYRIAGLPVHLPPLRERGDDVLLLAEAFVKQQCATLDRPLLPLDDGARAALRRYAFPGNVRELANLIERAVLLCEGDCIGEDALDLDEDSGEDLNSLVAEAPSTPGPAFVLPEGGVSLEQIERSLVAQALERSGGNKSQAAKLLGLSRATLRYRIDKYGMS